MEPIEIRQKRHELSLEILALCAAFEKDTNTTIDYIHTHHVREMGKIKPILNNIKIDISMDYLFND